MSKAQYERTYALLESTPYHWPSCAHTRCSWNNVVHLFLLDFKKHLTRFHNKNNVKATSPSWAHGYGSDAIWQGNCKLANYTNKNISKILHQYHCRQVRVTFRKWFVNMNSKIDGIDGEHGEHPPKCWSSSALKRIFWNTHNGMWGLMTFWRHSSLLVHFQWGR